MRVVAFTKSFQDWPIPLVCHRFREIGLDGLDLTVRRGGHIEPGAVTEQLPLAVKAAQEAGVQIGFLTTDITDPSSDAEQTLATASRLGIRLFKMGYYRYTTFGTLAKQIDDTRGRIEAVAKLAKKHGVLPCVHIHSGADIPSHGTQLYQLLQGFSPDEVGAYADMLHMALEGGDDGWRQGLDLLQPWMKLVSVKNFDWQSGERDQFGRLRWRHRVVPVADGISPVPEFVAVLKKMRFDGIYSMHSEYKGSHSYQDLDTEQCLQQTAADLKYFRQFLS